MRERACDICPFASSQELPCHPTQQQLSSLGESTLAAMAPCAFERLNEDSLTGLLSYDAFKARLQQQLEMRRATDPSPDQATQNEPRPGGFLFIDGKGVHELNNAVGHNKVDKGFQGIADVLRSSIRAGDLCCRRSGDEFIVFLPGSREVIETVKDRLQFILETGVPLPPPPEVNLGAKLYMQYSDNITSYEHAMELIDEADQYLGQQKRIREQGGQPNLEEL